MSEHEERLHRTIADLRATRAPSPRAEAELLVKLEQRLGGPPDGGSQGGSSGGELGLASEPGITLGWAAKLVGATVGLTAAGLLALRLGALVLAPTSERTTIEPPPIAHDDRQASEHPREPARVEPASMPEVHAEVDEPVSALRRQPVGLTPAPTDTPASEPSDRLAAELALLQAAKTAKTPSARLEQLDRHAEQFPAGALASEREALSVVALCELDRLDAARERARALARVHPGSPLLDRMREGCPTLGDELLDNPK